MLRRLLAIATLVAACGPVGPSPVVDGWPIGNPFVCAHERCAPYVEIAIDGLRARDAGHAPIIGTSLHELGVMIGKEGKQVLLVYSGGPPSVVLFQLADGTTRAIGVKYSGISKEASSMAWGPALDYAPPPGR